jgi:hypothetical protein
VVFLCIWFMVMFGYDLCPTQKALQ